MKIDKSQFTDYDQERINNVFINACFKGDFELVKFVLHEPTLKFRAEPFRTYISSQPLSGLYLACQGGYLDIVKYLLTSPKITIHPDINGDQGQALKNACSEGHFEVVKYLLNGDNLKRQADFFPSAIIAASNKGHFKIVQYLLTDPQINKYVNVSANNDEAFINACAGNHLEIAKYLLTSTELKTNTNIKKCINSAIFHCCIDGAIDTLDYILHLPQVQGVFNIHMNGDSPFICSLEEKHMHITHYLIFDYNIPYTDEIKRYIKDYKIEEVAKLFETRDLSNELNNQVKNNPTNIIHKKPKL